MVTMKVTNIFFIRSNETSQEWSLGCADVPSSLKIFLMATVPTEQQYTRNRLNQMLNNAKPIILKLWMMEVLFTTLLWVLRCLYCHQRKRLTIILYSTISVDNTYIRYQWQAQQMWIVHLETLHIIGIKTTKIKTKSSQCNRSMYISKQENVSYKNNEQNYLSKQLSYEHDSLNKQKEHFIVESFDQLDLK